MRRKRPSYQKKWPNGELERKLITEARRIAENGQFVRIDLIRLVAGAEPTKIGDRNAAQGVMSRLLKDGYFRSVNGNGILTFADVGRAIPWDQFQDQRRQYMTLEARARVNALDDHIEMLLRQVSAARRLQRLQRARVRRHEARIC